MGEELVVVRELVINARSGYVEDVEAEVVIVREFVVL